MSLLISPRRSLPIRFIFTIADARSSGEERWVTVGEAANGKALVIAHTYFVGEGGHGMIRIISARRATRREAKQYEERI